MKRILLFLFFVMFVGNAFAQNKNNVFLDVACNNLGGSVTYDRKLAKHLEAGGGLNTYNFNGEPYYNVHSACYVDLRPYWAIKKSILFEYNDIGVAVNGGRKADSASVSRESLYIAFGFGYCYRINKRGWGPYAAVGMCSYLLNEHDYKQHLAPEAKNYSIINADIIFSIGFKF